MGGDRIMKYYKRVNKSGIITTVESYSHDLPVEGAIEINKSAYDHFIARLPKPIAKPNRDIPGELDALVAKLIEKGVITE